MDHLSEDAGADFQISDEVGGGSDIGNEITDQVQDEVRPFYVLRVTQDLRHPRTYALQTGS